MAMINPEEVDQLIRNKMEKIKLVKEIRTSPNTTTQIFADGHEFKWYGGWLDARNMTIEEIQAQSKIIDNYETNTPEEELKLQELLNKK
jgi:hypothetical protein